MEVSTRKTGKGWQVVLTHEHDGDFVLCDASDEGCASVLCDALSVVLPLWVQCEISRYDRDKEVMEAAFFQILHIGRSLSGDHPANYRPSDPIRDWL